MEKAVSGRDERNFFILKEKKSRNTEKLQERLYQEIGKLKIELDWLKKSLIKSVTGKGALIESEHLLISIRR